MTHATVEEDNSAGFAFWLRFWCRVVAALQIAGGLCGIYIVAFGSVSGNFRVIFLVAFCLFVATVWSGILLMLDRQGGVAASLVVQAFQLVQVNVPGVLYSFGCEMQFIVGFSRNDDSPVIGFNFSYPSRFSIFLNPPPHFAAQGGFSGLNLVALLCIVCLLLARAAEKRRVLETIPEIADVPEPDNAWPPAPKP